MSEMGPKMKLKVFWLDLTPKGVLYLSGKGALLTIGGRPRLKEGKYGVFGKYLETIDNKEHLLPGQVITLPKIHE